MLTRRFRRASSIASARSAPAAWTTSSTRRALTAAPSASSSSAVCVWYLRATPTVTCCAGSRLNQRKPANNLVVQEVGQDVDPLVEARVLVVAEEATEVVVHLVVLANVLTPPLFLTKTKTTEIWVREDLVVPRLGKLLKLQKTIIVSKDQENPVKISNLKHGFH